jgi:hypothetical protein
VVRVRAVARAAMAIALATGCGPVPGHTPRDTGPAVRSVAYTTARCFNGSVFTPCTLHVAGGMFVAPPARADSTIDLDGAYVIAPFGEAHNHNVEPGDRLGGVLEAYRQAGVLYVQNLNSLPEAAAGVAAIRAPHPAPEVSFAGGGLTGPGGHPSQIAAANIARGRWTVSQGEGAFYHTVDGPATLDAAWRALTAMRPDVVKVYLLYSDRYAERLTDSTYVGWRGLDPALVPDIVRRARSAGLRVAAHVETAADFRTAVAAGVDIIAHLPGFRGDERTALPDLTPYLLTATDAHAASAAGTVVVSTIAPLARYADAEGDRALRQATDSLQRANLTLLRRAGVRIAIGSDEYDEHSVDEARYLAALGVFTRAEVLRMWSEVTPRAIFPGRRIGRLEPGYEASFVVLRADPLADFDAVTDILRVVHKGASIAHGRGDRVR